VTEWEAAREPFSLLQSLRADPPADSHRLVWLFAIACARQVWNLLPTDALSALSVAERYVDGVATVTDLVAVTSDVLSHPVTAAGHALLAAYCAVSGDHLSRTGPFAGVAVWQAADSAARSIASRWAGPAPLRVGPNWHERWTAGMAAARAVQADLVRCIFLPPGTPPPAFDPDWRTSAVRRLADAMYEARDFAPMPILADALQDAGCEDAAVLAHCRGPGPHARGCWVVDLVRGS
jgi:hypothetical protein